MTDNKARVEAIALLPEQEDAAKVMYRSYRVGIQGKLFFLDADNCKKWFAAFKAGLDALNTTRAADPRGDDFAKDDASACDELIAKLRLPIDDEKQELQALCDILEQEAEQRDELLREAVAILAADKAACAMDQLSMEYRKACGDVAYQRDAFLDRSEKLGVK